MDSGNSDSMQSSRGAFMNLNPRLHDFSPSPPPPNLNCTNTGNLLGSLDSTLPAPLVLNPSAPMQLSSSHASENGATAPVLTSDHQPYPTAVVRTSKKRSKASRRAPTTVLTTDTSNFRAMVQEFTGIPAPPFSPLPFSRVRLDLFRNPTTMIRSALPSPPHFSLLRPFLSPTLLESSSNVADGIASMSCDQQPPHQQALPKQTQDLVNVQNSTDHLTVHSLLVLGSSHSSNHPLRISGADLQGSEGAQLTADDPHVMMNMPTLELDDENHGQVGGAAVASLQVLVPSSGGPARSDSTSSRLLSDHHLNVPLRFLSANNYVVNAHEQVLNGGCSSTDFYVEKLADQNVASREEGLVDSWVCPPD